VKLSTKGRYASRAMLDLALHVGEGPIMVKDIARRHSLSERYLEQLLIPLKTAGLIRGIRGARGGFILAKPPSEIRMLDIIRIMEREVWKEMKEAIDNVLMSTTLEDLRAKHIKAEGTAISGEGCK